MDVFSISGSVINFTEVCPRVRDSGVLTIGKISEQNGKQLLLVKIKSQIKRKQFLRNSIKLRDNVFYSLVFVDLDLTKSEREAQYQLRVEKRTLQEKYSEKKFVIKNGKVIDKR